ncbi:acetyl-CoA synthetase-like protein [Macrolepiota fuliginosa MF-IS2]|uniref:Acetyl-CoA synthetase-like protein n=1 Tax=Macrolepiota fuliginosa MF-IS2 TaxID=1400762 RepID=A0A9P5XLH9_9AGAR|nr:acetyl-CoA synthetase-like protein [Macrolepiota fuliginosa MF-IS2]
MVTSHLAILEASSSRFSQLPVFQTPVVDQETGAIASWQSISYRQFQRDVERFARFWQSRLLNDGVAPHSVVGVWIGGFTYTDLLHIYGLSRAGYIPQLFSLRLPSPEVIYELLARAEAKALVYEPAFAATCADCPVPAHLAVGSDCIPESSTPLSPLPPVTEDDVAFIFHTSGSTSGSPKLVPCNYRWITAAKTKSFQVSAPRNKNRQDVTVWMGSMCHIGQSFMLLGSLQHGSCTIQPTVISFSSEELMDMIHRCGLNRLNQFAAFLANHLRRSRSDKNLLSEIVGLDEVLYSGLPLPRDEEEWAYKNGIKLRNTFGSTECGAMLLSIGGEGRDAPLLRPLVGMAYEFRPIVQPISDASHQSTKQLLELVILKSSGDCPSSSLRHADGDFHTGDLFQEVNPGSYVFRGRDDDWIKSENSLRCDTKAIEDNARAMCSAIIKECIVVGSGRPSPVMFIEPAVEMDHDKLRKEIIRKTRQFHSRRYLHERITSPSMIVVVPPQTLPRTVTKGNIRRKAVEEAFKAQIDQIFGVVA